ncbi:hypothetical protein D3C85_1705800 [compost metagenome]
MFHVEVGADLDICQAGVRDEYSIHTTIFSFDNYVMIGRRPLSIVEVVAGPAIE